MNNILVGCDPEVFILDDKGKPKSVEGLIGGTKYKPIWFKKGEYSLQEDNVMAEIGIKPASNALEFSSRIKGGLEEINQSISLRTSELFNKEVLNTEQAKKSGCEPDFNVYLKSMNTPFNLKKDRNRYAGGHIHIGLGNDWQEEYEVEKLVMSMDYHLNNLKDKRKRNAYRRIGNFRLKPYGIEYRTLSNEWIFNHRSRIDIFNRTLLSIKKHKDISYKEESLLYNYYQETL